MAESPIEKAIRETDAHVADARAATRLRNLWHYLRASELERWAKARGLVGDTDQLMRLYFEKVIKDPDAIVLSGETDSIAEKGGLERVIMHAVYVGIAWRIVCPDGGHRRTMQIPDLEIANRALVSHCTEIDLDADIQTPCPGGDHRLEKLPPLTNPTF